MSSHSPDWAQGPSQPPRYPPPTDGGQTQAVPRFVPPSYSETDRFPPPEGGGSPPGGKNHNQRTVLAGVLTGVAALVAIIGGAYAYVSSGDDGSGGNGETTAGTDGEADEATTDPPDTPAQLGTTVRGTRLATGDCIDHNLSGGSVETFEIVACEEPHTTEVSGQIEHPDAAQTYPGVDELARFSTGCDVVTNGYIGADSFTTTLLAGALLPDPTDWDEGQYQVLCTVSSADGASLTGSAKGNTTSFARGSRVEIGRLATGDCFNLNSTDLTTLSATDLVDRVGCDQPHVGYFFGRDTLHQYGQAAAYPGDAETSQAALDACDLAFNHWFTVPADGFEYDHWSPDATAWESYDRIVLCAVLDIDGLPAELAYASYQTVWELPVGTCYLLPPAVSVEELALDSKVEAIDCSASHNGQIFGAGEFVVGTYPGDDGADSGSNASCSGHFGDFVGLGPTDSVHGNYVYWSPYEQGWNDSDDRRYSCTILRADPVVGTIEGAGI